MRMESLSRWRRPSIRAFFFFLTSRMSSLQTNFSPDIYICIFFFLEKKMIETTDSGPEEMNPMTQMG